VTAAGDAILGLRFFGSSFSRSAAAIISEKKLDNERKIGLEHFSRKGI
jgi:hypothetical protein